MGDGRATAHSGQESTRWHLIGDLAPGKAKRIAWSLTDRLITAFWLVDPEAPDREYANGTCAVYQDEKERTWRQFPNMGRAQRISSEEIDSPGP